MQLEAKMKQRFSWTVLLLLTACLVHSSQAERTDTTCDSNGIVGTFSQNKVLDSLTITPIEFNKTLDVYIGKEWSDNDRSIQIYMTLDQESTCTGGNFDIASNDGNTKCSFKYTVEKDGSGNGKLTMDGKTALAFDYSDPYQASFEVQVNDQGAATKVTAQTSEGNDVELTKADCFTNVDKSTNFTMKFTPFDGANGEECGVQFEMKGLYQALKLTMDKIDCKLVEGAGESNNDDPHGDETTTSSGADTTTASGTATWVWIAVGVGGGVILILVIVGIVLIYCFCCKKKKDSADDEEDVEAAPEEPDVPPAADAASTATGPGAEPSGVETTQQNPEDNPEDKPKDKPEEEEDDDE